MLAYGALDVLPEFLELRVEELFLLGNRFLKVGEEDGLERVDRVRYHEALIASRAKVLPQVAPVQSCKRLSIWSIYRP